MLESERARIAAIRRYKEHISNPATVDIKLRAIEVRMESAGPDISLHQCSGTRTQGGYLFFVEDLVDAQE